MRYLFRLIVWAVVDLFRSRAAIEAEILTLRQQIIVLRRTAAKKQSFGAIDRLVFVGLYRLLPPGTHADYEIDHLIPLCLGGSDDRSNLWAQPRRSIEPTWNAEAKDRLERFMCDMVCGGPT